MWILTDDTIGIDPVQNPSVCGLDHGSVDDCDDSRPVRGVPGRVYNIGGGSRVSLREVFDLIARVSGRKVTIDHQGPQKGDMRDTYADTSRAQADLGFKPSVTLEEGLRNMWQWMEANK